MPTLNHWQSVDPPYVELLVLKDGQPHERAITPPPGFAVTVIHGEQCRTKDDLLSEFARMMTFPYYFGKNWDALEDCLIDLAWLPAAGYLLIITEAEQVLRRHREDYQTFIEILKNAGKEWATPRAGEWPLPAIPFHTVFTVSAGLRSTREDWHLPLLKP
jgi:RNAse (barnase) inhibitor barstar